MVLDLTSLSDGDLRLNQAAGVVDGGYFSDSQSTPTDSLSDGGSSRDSLSSVSSVASVPLEYSTSLSRFPSGSCQYADSFSRAGNTTTTHVDSAKWLETVNNVQSTNAIPLEQRQNPRRSGQTSLTTNGEANKPPCSLIRQSERKDCFVAILVGFAAQLVEAIWPLAACTPRTDTCFFGRGVLPLRTFITETLRRSRTSYSTLQVALFYLVLIKDQIPKSNFCMEQSRAEDEFRTMQCGRRMFLTALILASKYLQDRNYSTRAWSKISGLRAKEIHINELNYCKTIGWSLHVPQEKFQQWSRIVLRLSAPSMGPGSETLAQHLGWPTVLGKLNADLTETFENFDGITIGRRNSPDLSALSPNANFTFGDNCSEKSGLDNFKGIFNNETSTADATPQVTTDAIPRPPSVLSQPPLPRIHNLPTPQTTPQLNAFRNPCPASRNPSMYAAMSQARNNCFMRATIDLCPPPQGCPTLRDNRYAEPIGRSNLCQSTTSLASSPESMISDASSISSRASRSSSISSMASSTSTSSQPHRLDRLACRRAAGIYDSRSSLSDLYNKHGKSKPLTLEPTIRDTELDSVSDYSSPDSCEGTTSDDGTSDRIHAQDWTMTNAKFHWRLQELEVAAALCKLRPTPASSVMEYGSNATTPQPRPLTSEYSSSQNTPTGNLPNHSVSVASREQSFSKVMPRPSGLPALSEDTTSSQKPHKRSHSKVTDNLQDEVRSQLANWSGDYSQTLPNVELDSSPPRSHSAQSPTLTYGVTKTPVSVKGGKNNKRWCSNEVPAAEQAARWLRPDISKMVTPM